MTHVLHTANTARFRFKSLFKHPIENISRSYKEKRIYKTVYMFAAWESDMDSKKSILALNVPIEFTTLDGRLFHRRTPP